VLVSDHEAEVPPGVVVSASQRPRASASRSTRAAAMQQGVREARRRRDARGQAWDNALASLKNDARAAAKDGTPHIYATLFPPSRPVPKSKAAAETAPAATNTPPNPAPGDSGHGDPERRLIDGPGRRRSRLITRVRRFRPASLR